MGAGDERAGGVEVEEEIALPCPRAGVGVVGAGGFERGEGGGSDGVAVVRGEDVVRVRVVVGGRGGGGGGGG